MWAGLNVALSAANLADVSGAVQLADIPPLRLSQCALTTTTTSVVVVVVVVVYRSCKSGHVGRSKRGIVSC